MCLNLSELQDCTIVVSLHLQLAVNKEGKDLEMKIKVQHEKLNKEKEKGEKAGIEREAVLRSVKEISKRGR